MSLERFWYEVTKDTPLILRSPDDDDADEKEGDEEGGTEDGKKKSKGGDDATAQLNARIAKLERALKREQKLREELQKGTVKPDQLPDLIASLSKRREDAKEDAEESAATGDEDKLPAGVKAQFSKMEKTLAKLQKDNENLAKQAAEKESAIKLERRQHAIESKLAELGANNPGHAYRIMKDLIVEDAEVGDAVKVKTAHGDDLVKAVDYLAQFKEENPYLFSPAAKSGSGAGGGGPKDSKARYTDEQLRDPSQGGMSWDDYEKNRSQIHADMEKRTGK